MQPADRKGKVTDPLKTGPRRKEAIPLSCFSLPSVSAKSFFAECGGIKKESTVDHFKKQE